MLRLDGVPQHYAWGSLDGIPAILGTEPTEQPVAELWFGAHPLGDSPVEGDGALSTVLVDDPGLLGTATAETFDGRLPYLVKLLSAASPLSLQAHPSRSQAEQGYARESLHGVPLDAPQRSFKDDWPKPEAIFALTPFEGLVGFRDPLETAQLFESLGVGDELESVIGPLRDRAATPALQEVFLDVLSLGERRHLVDELLGAAVARLDAPGAVGEFARTAVELDEHFPGDPSILAALLLNRFRLEPGEGVALEAGVMHAYLKGTGVEVMANSDNVLRGGLTKKHIDVDALLQVVSFEATPVTVLLPQGTDGLYRFPTALEEFEVWLVQPCDQGPVQLPRDDSGRICLVTEGTFELEGDGDPVTLRPGQAVFVGAGEQVGVTGAGRMFTVASGA